VGVIKDRKKEQLTWVWGLLFPILAILGALLVVYGGFTAPKFNVYFIVSLFGIVLGLGLRPKQV